MSANMNIQNNPGTTGALCAIFAKSSGNWRNVIRKAFLPEDIVGDTPEKEAARVAHVKKAVPGVTENTVVRFALLDRRDGTSPQFQPFPDLDPICGTYLRRYPCRQDH